MRRDEFPLLDKLMDDAYQQGREDAIDEFKKEMSEMKRKAYQFLNSDYATGYISALSTLEGYAEQIREKK